MYIMQLDNIKMTVGLQKSQVTRFSIASLLYNNTATPKSGCYTLGLETNEVAEANAKVIDLSLERTRKKLRC